MPFSHLRIIKRYAEFIDRKNVELVPSNTRGFYTLLQKGKTQKEFHVIYVGLSRGEKAGIRGRLRSHLKSKSKGSAWTHFSIYEVHDNITASEIEELEGLFRHIYRRDKFANEFNKQKKFKRLTKSRINNLKKWHPAA